MKLALELDADRFAPGEEVRGRVLVLEGGGSRSLTLTVSFRERSPSYVETPFSDGATLHEGELASGQALDFGFVFPNDAPPSVKGRHGELFWEVEAVSDVPGLDTRVSRVLEVAARSE